MPAFSFGPVLSTDRVLFRLWAPFHTHVKLKIDGLEGREMLRVGEGWHHCEVAGAGAGTLYGFVLPDGLEVPDPGSRFQPQDVHGPSQVVDLSAFRWNSKDWQGRPWEEIVLYELHLGSFTREGGFRAAIERLDHLKELGVTGVQIMPVSDFPGRYNWGYDGVLPYAPDSSYGRPEDLMALVDAAHAHGICVFLDVVYNHFGPDGNFMPNYAPLFTEQHKTPWGNGINYDGESSKPVREYVIQNAIYWITQFQLDGLRLDAVHAIKDDSQEHLLHELARRVREAAGERHVHLIVENEDNNSDLLRRNEQGKTPLFTAQWNDDVHHVLHVAATRETFGYYADYADDAAKVGRALAEGFVFQGEHMPYRGEARGKPSADLPPTAFISFIQNHDQIGNRALGERMITYRPQEPIKAVTALYLLAPQIPMLFMGEEWGAREPFPYFCDFDEELNEKVRQGRREELSRLPGFNADDLPDPTAHSTFESAKLDWSKLGQSATWQALQFYRTLLAIRHQRIVPLLKGIGGQSGTFQCHGTAIAVDWRLAGGARLHLLANLCDETASVGERAKGAEEIFSVGSIIGGSLAPWSAIWSITRLDRSPSTSAMFEKGRPMKRSELDDLACQYGISLTRPCPDSGEVPVSDETKRKVLKALGVDLKAKVGASMTGEGQPRKRDSKRPRKKKIPRSYIPEFLKNSRVWGISLQLYELRSARNWGIGDFEDLCSIAGLVGSLGAEFIGLNPLHAPFLADPDRCSPYEPSNRQRLNPLYIAVDKVPGFQPSVELDRRLNELRATELVDYVGIAQAKLGALRELWRIWGRTKENDPAYARTDFEAFIRQGGEGLRRHALFETISVFMGERGHGTGWQAWPAEFQDCGSKAVSEFATDHAEEIRFHIWLQWLAHRQLTKAAEQARQAGLRIGLYLDLAVGEAVDGSATWSEREVYIAEATVGSPPDPFATEGQDWHLAAFHPAAIASGKNSPYLRMVTAAMRYAGAIRIDHAAALRRLFLVPLDSRPDSGAYVDYPQERLLQILSQASAEHRCLVIGEDLGMLPEGLQDDLAEAQILSYRILSYEREKGSFKPAEIYPTLALACISTHDHQTLAGWWRGADIKVRAEHGIVPTDVTEKHVEERKHERKGLKEVLEEAGAEPPERLSNTANERGLSDLVVSAHRFIAKTPSLLAAVRLADLTSEKNPTNIPGTSDSYPNWKPKLSVSLEDLLEVPLLQDISGVMREERPRL